MHRLFFALWPAPQDAQRLAAGIAPHLAGPGAAAVAAPDLHVTLSFLGELDQAREALAVQRAGALAATAFELRLDRLEYWSAAQVLVLAASGVPDTALTLESQVRALARDLDCMPEPAPWRAHMTLARRVSPAAAPRPERFTTADQGPLLRLAAQQFCLAQSLLAGSIPSATGALRYRRLHAWPLHPPAP